ncbi:hypothetical protein [Ochrovirga pacifica]|uniref:hypothetical protein n=1 Tax=Ochrovirga pacifica TaxID=1042376 RepID=UPI000255A556|nr:hypothetical protein [Ochrovirga pacifica]
MLEADLSASNLAFNSVKGIVKYNVVATGLDTPRGYGEASFLTVLEDQNKFIRKSKTIDVGAWELRKE